MILTFQYFGKGLYLQNTFANSAFKLARLGSSDWAKAITNLNLFAFYQAVTILMLTILCWEMHFDHVCIVI